MTTWEKQTDIRFPITKLYPFYKSNGVRDVLAVSNQKLHVDNNGTLTNVTGTLTSNSVKLLTYKDRSITDSVLIADKGKLKAYNGTSVSEVTPHSPSTQEQGDPGLNDLVNLTNFRAIAIKKDRMFAAAHPSVKNRVHFCHHDPSIGYAVYDYWPATFFFDVATDDNDEIVELKVFRDGLIILCKRSIWLLTGDGRTLSDYQLHRINVPSGCIAPESVQMVGNNLFYLSDNHVYSLYSTDQNYVSAQIVSRNVEGILKGIAKTDKAKASSAFFDNKYYLSFPNGTCLVYDALIESWVKWTNVQANSFLEKDGVLYFGSEDGYIYQFDEAYYRDDDSPINFQIKTKILDFKQEVQVKKIRRLWVLSKQYDGYKTSFDLKNLIDGHAAVEATGDPEVSGDPFIWDESNWDENLWDFSEIAQTEKRVRQKAKSLQLIVSNEKIDEPVTIYGVVFEYKTKKP